MMKQTTFNRELFETLFEARLPSVLAGRYAQKKGTHFCNQQEIMEAVDFLPPFLKIRHMAIFEGDPDSIKNSVSIAVGLLTPQDTHGHYFDSIYLAMCGLLMGSAASTHLGILFPTTAPQVVEVDYIRPSKDTVLYRPRPEGSPFFIETTVLGKKLALVVVNVRIFFGDIYMGEVDNLKLVLTPRESLAGIKLLPEWR